MGKKKNPEKEEQYEVEVITKARATQPQGQHPTWEYLVKWAGYSSDDDTWEPRENLKTCDRLLHSFWIHIDTKVKDCLAGFEVEAKPEWITQEKQYFAKAFTRGEQKQDQKPKKPLKEENISSSSKWKIKTDTKNTTSDSEPHGETLTIKIPPNNRPAFAATSNEKVKPDDPLPTSADSAALTSNDGPAPDKEPERDMASSSPTSLFSEPYSPVPDHHERQVNPRVKLLPLEPGQIAGGSGLSTKKRLAQTTVAETTAKPKVVPVRSTLMPLGFKKKLLLPTDGVQLDDVRETKSKSSAVQVVQLTPAVEERFFSGDVPEIAASLNSPTQDFMPLVEEDDPFASFASVSVQEPLQSPNPLNPQNAAEEFIQSMTPKELAAPLTDTFDKSPQAVSPRRPIKTPLLPKIPKKWRWTGKLLMDTAGEKMEQVCDIALTGATERLAEDLRLSVVFSSMDSIRFSKLHNVSDLDIVLRACKPVHQLAKLGPHDEKDTDALGKLVRYMDKRRQVTFVPVSLDNAVVGILLVFPATMHELHQRFNVPNHLQQIGVFVSALLPWSLSAAEQREQLRAPYCADTVPFNTLGSDRREITLKRHPNFHRAIQMLQFPRWLHDYMSQPDRPYCVWWTPSDGTWKEPGIETELLRCVLKQCKAKDVGYKADVRAVFVHVGALKSLYRLPALAERRSKRPEIGFFTYGTHEDVSPDRWGIRAIFRLGGIVSFTPNALIEDPVRVYQLMGRLAKHCLWECYILPSTIGMAAKLTSAGQDPLILQDKGVFILGLILAMIEEGEVSLIRAPPTRCAPRPDNDPTSKWIGQQAKQQGLNSRGLLEACMEAFDDEYSKVQESELSSAIESNICRDMLGMQCQPVLMDNYRRYVVIKAENDEHISWDRSGLEWLPPSKFSFRDDYFGIRPN